MNDNMNRGSDLKNKIAKKAASSIGGPLAGKAVEKLGKKNGNSDLIAKKSASQNGSASSEIDKNGLSDGEGGAVFKRVKTNALSKDAAEVDELVGDYLFSLLSDDSDMIKDYVED